MGPSPKPLPQVGSPVLYRDHRKFLAGQPDHTDYFTVIGRNEQSRTIALRSVRGAQEVTTTPDWVHVITPEEIMSDLWQGSPQTAAQAPIASAGSINGQSPAPALIRGHS